jgi:dTDP-4-amino-4,6-dideoxygalactose transaminase
MWKVPLFDLNYDEKEEAAVAGVLRSKWLTMGPHTQKFEESFSAYLGEEVNSVAVSSCTAALHLSLLAAGIGPGDEVIISGLSFVACLNVVCMVGATPVLADSLSLDDWNVSPMDIRARITPRTRAVIVVHFAGYPCAMEDIAQIAQEYGLLLIEDVAHAVGASYHGRKCGTFGDMACFSFFSNKNLSTGEGGMVVSANQEYYRKLKLLRSHGMTSMTIDRHNSKCISYDVVMPGLNYRMTELNAVLGTVQLQKLDNANGQRREHVQLYRTLLAGREVHVPWSSDPADSEPSYHIFPVLLPHGTNRLSVMEALRTAGIQTSLHYPAYRDFTGYAPFIEQSVPIAEEISSRVITLPLYPTMTAGMIEDVCEQVLRAV